METKKHIDYNPLFTQRLLCIFCLLISTIGLKAQTDIDNYINSYRSSGLFKSEVENSLLENYKLKTLINDLEPFYADTTLSIRRKAYYLSFKKARMEKEANQSLAVVIFTQGLTDKHGSIINQNLAYLKQFSLNSYSKKAKQNIAAVLSLKKYQSFSDIYLIAGFIDSGYENMNRLYLNPDVPKKVKWKLQLALARMGKQEALEQCLQQTNAIDIDNQFVTHIVPDLLYTRQHQAINSVISILNSDEKNCSSPNAESSAPMVCGYRIMELLADVIEAYPFKTDASGMLICNSYPDALETVRIWFNSTKEYQIYRDNF